MVSNVGLIKSTLASLIILVIYSSSFSQADQTLKKEISDKKCSHIIEGLKLCNPNSNLSFKLDEKVTFNLTLQNMTKKIIPLPNIIHPQGFPDFRGHSLTFKITDANGDDFPARKDTVQENNVVSLPIYSNPGRFSINPTEGEINVWVNLSEFYDFKIKGKYQVKITRKIYKKNGKGFAELSLEPIEFEIK